MFAETPSLYITAKGTPGLPHVLPSTAAWPPQPPASAGPAPTSAQVVVLPARPPQFPREEGGAGEAGCAPPLLPCG